MKIKNEELKSVNEDIKSAQSEQENYQNLLNTNLDKEARLKKVIDIVTKDEYNKTVDDIRSYETEINKSKI